MYSGVFIGAAAGLLFFIGWELTIILGRCVCITMECDEIVNEILETPVPSARPQSDAGEIDKKYKGWPPSPWGSVKAVPGQGLIGGSDRRTCEHDENAGFCDAPAIRHSGLYVSPDSA